jgi:hypothetical protein
MIATLLCILGLFLLFFGPLLILALVLRALQDSPRK